MKPCRQRYPRAQVQGNYSDCKVAFGQLCANSVCCANLRHYASQNTLVFASIFQTHNIGDADHDCDIGASASRLSSITSALTHSQNASSAHTCQCAYNGVFSTPERKYHRLHSRKTMSCIMLFARAQARLPTKKIARATRRITFRPKMSLNREYIGWNAVLVNR